MGKPTTQELALQAEVRQLRERIAKIEQGRQAEASLVGEIDLQSLRGVRGPAQENDARHSGITVIGDVPWGTHFCQFYQDQQDLIDILVPYFKAGLENNEFCIWITSEPLASDEAKAALVANVENLETYIAAGQLEILDSGEFYNLGGTFEPDRAFHALIDRVETATRRGFAGLRVTGNLSWLEKPNWQAFTEYEAAVNAVIGNYPMLALCSYTLSKCGAIEIMDIISNHAFALTKRAGKWERIDSAERKKVGVSLRDSEARFRALLTATSDTVYRMSPDWKEIFYLRGRDFILDSAEPAGTWLQKYIPRDDQQFVTAAIDEAIRNQSVFELEHRVLLVDGCLGWTFSRAIPIRNAEGEIVEWFGSASDITERKRAEEALRRSEARWNAAIENLGAAVVIATDTEQVIYRNPAALAMHGFTSGQGLGPLQDMTRIFELWTPDGRLLTLDEWPLRRIKRGETLNRLELRIRRLDQGWEKIISYSGAMVESAIGERLMFVSAQDLTDQRKAEHLLRESEERLRLLGDHLPDSALYQYVDEPGIPGRYTYFSAGIERLTGVTAEDAVRDKSTLHSQILPENMDRCVEAKSRSKRDLSDFDNEVHMRRADGEIRWIHFHARPRRLPDGQTIWDGVATDVTARKQAEDALRESQRRLVSIYNTVEDGIFHLAVEPAGQFRIVSVNAAFLRVTGLSQEKVIGKNVNEVIPEPSLTMVLRKYRQAIEENTVVHWEETSDYPAGRLTGEVSVAPVFDMTGTCTHLIGSVHDITERRRAQEIKNRLTSDLTASRDEIRALAASLMRVQEDERRRVSRELHDQICNQLVSLGVDIGKLTVGPPPPPRKTRTQLEAIQARVVKTSQEAHDIAYQMHTAILDDLGLVASLKHLCSQFSEHHPDIALDFEDSGPPASIPSEVASCLYRVAQESLQNIARHSRAKCVSAHLGFEKEAVVLTIQDDGAGFDPKAVKGHRGLGLISMKERAHLVNGTLKITAGFGQGTRIALKVPLPVPQPIERPRVLLADDHPLVLEEIRSALAMNYEIVGTVADGRALVEAALRLKPDLIVVDITMPLLNGIDAAVQIRKSLPGMKLLFVTMHASATYVKAAFEAGGTGYVLKSGLRDELSDAVQNVLGGRTYVSHGLPALIPGTVPGSYAPARS